MEIVKVFYHMKNLNKKIKFLNLWLTIIRINSFLVYKRKKSDQKRCYLTYFHTLNCDSKFGLPKNQKRLILSKNDAWEK